MENVRSIKSVAKEAKKRLKSRFWEDYKSEVVLGVEKAKESGVSPSKVEDYFKSKIVRSVKGENKDDEKFYSSVKEMLDREGSLPSDALDKLMDKDYFESLDYFGKERYLFNLSKRYLKAIERYDNEKGVEKIVI